MADLLMVTDNNLESIAVRSLVEQAGHRLTPLPPCKVEDNIQLIQTSALNIIDIDNVGEDSSDITEFFTHVNSEAPVIWLAANGKNRKLNYASIASGAKGCLRKADISELVPSLQRAMDGEFLYTKAVLIAFIQEIAPLAPPVLFPLSERETHVLEMLQCGLTNREIADRLNVSIETIKHDIATIKDTLHLKHRRQFMMGARATSNCSVKCD